MNIKYFILLLITILHLPLHAEFPFLGSWYSNSLIGLNFHNQRICHTGDSIGPGLFIGEAVGFKGECLRGEVEVGWRKNSFNGTAEFMNDDEEFHTRLLVGHTDTWSFMVNLLKDLRLSRKVSCYVGAGIGYATPSWKMTSSENKTLQHHFHLSAYQVLCGIELFLFKNWSAKIDYHQLSTEKKDVNNTFSLGVTHLF